MNKKARKRYIHICKFCGSEFTSFHSKQNYCSKSCATKSRKVEDFQLFKNMSDFEYYCLGYFYADGCLYYSKHSGCWKISFSSNDYELMKVLHSKICPTKKIYKNRNGYQVLSTNLQDVDYLKSLGITERKTYNLLFPAIPEEYEASFIRGFFDGDGCVYKNKVDKYVYTYYSICCLQESFLLKIKEILEKNSIYSKITVDKRKKRPFYMLNIRRKEDCQKFFDYIYKNETFSLKRKKEKYYNIDIV